MRSSVTVMSCALRLRTAAGASPLAPPTTEVALNSSPRKARPWVASVGDRPSGAPLSSTRSMRCCGQGIQGRRGGVGGRWRMPSAGAWHQHAALWQAGICAHSVPNAAEPPHLSVLLQRRHCERRAAASRHRGQGEFNSWRGVAWQRMARHGKAAQGHPLPCLAAWRLQPPRSNVHAPASLHCTPPTSPATRSLPPWHPAPAAPPAAE